MKFKYLTWMGILSILWVSQVNAGLPENFTYLKEVDPSIVQEIRYAGDHNFIGSPLKGYDAAECILTKPTAKALAAVQKELMSSGFSLKVYDCYRPQMAVDEFVAWSKLPNDHKMKAEFYPAVNKADVLKLGYVASKSGHSRGSTLDLTIIPVMAVESENYQQGKKLVSCTAPYLKRFRDNSIDMGTGYDCMDPKSHSDAKLEGVVPKYNRLILKNVMEKQGFVPYDKEWWHFTLKDEPYPDTYFNFPISPSS